MITAANYTRKDPNIEVVKVDYYQINLTELDEWLNENNSFEYDTIQSTVMPALVTGWQGGNLSVTHGDYLAKDTNGKIFKLSEETLLAFYDEV